MIDSMKHFFPSTTYSELVFNPLILPRPFCSQQAGYGAAGVQQESGSSQEVFNETLFNSLLANQEILTGARRVGDTILARATAQDRAIKRAAELQYAQSSAQGGLGIVKLYLGLTGGGG